MWFWLFLNAEALPKLRFSKVGGKYLTGKYFWVETLAGLERLINNVYKPRKLFRSFFRQPITKS